MSHSWVIINGPFARFNIKLDTYVLFLVM